MRVATAVVQDEMHLGHKIAHQVSREDLRGRVHFRAPQGIRPDATHDNSAAEAMEMVPHLRCAKSHSEAMAPSMSYVEGK